jgi:hypothetical protein
MTARSAIEEQQPSLPRLVVKSLSFLVRKWSVFAIVASPIPAIAAGAAWVIEFQRQFDIWRDPWLWDLLFAVAYAMLLDRWIKETLLDGAFDCDEVDNLRRSIIAPRFLLFAGGMYVLAYLLGAQPFGWIAGDSQLGPVLEGVINWSPQAVVWALVFAMLSLMLPSLSAAEPIKPLQALRLGRRVRPSLIGLALGVTLLSMAGDLVTRWGLTQLPHKSWAPSAMAGAHRLLDCLLIVIVGHCLATLYRQLTDWRQPEPEDHPYRGLGQPPRKDPFA